MLSVSWPKQPKTVEKVGTPTVTTNTAFRKRISRKGTHAVLVTNEAFPEDDATYASDVLSRRVHIYYVDEDVYITRVVESNPVESVIAREGSRRDGGVFAEQCCGDEHTDENH